jgi:hypothetical protein
MVMILLWQENPLYESIEYGQAEMVMVMRLMIGQSQTDLFYCNKWYSIRVSKNPLMRIDMCNVHHEDETLLF